MAATIMPAATWEPMGRHHKTSSAKVAPTYRTGRYHFKIATSFSNLQDNMACIPNVRGSFGIFEGHIMKSDCKYLAATDILLTYFVVIIHNSPKLFTINIFKTSEYKLISYNVHFNGPSWCTSYKSYP